MNMVNQAFRIKIAYQSQEKGKKKKKKKEEKIPGIGRYPMGPTITLLTSGICVSKVRLRRYCSY